MKLMTKRVLAVVMALALTLGMAVSAMAAWDGVPSKDREAIETVNGGNASGTTFTNKTGFSLGGRNFITKFVDVLPEEEGNAGSASTGGKRARKNANGTYTITLSGGAGYTDVCMLHYSVVKQKWEMKSGNTCTWDDLSPLALVGKKKSSGSSSSSSSGSSAKSPKTGMDGSWILWLLAAGVFAGSSVVVYNRKRG